MTGSSLTSATRALFEEVAVRRPKLKLDLSREVARAFVDEEVDRETFAGEVGVDDSLVSRWSSPRCKDSIGLVETVLAAGKFPTMAHRLLRWVGDRSGFEIVPIEGARPVTIPLAALVLKLSGVTVAAVDGEADGILTPEEAQRELEQWNELLRVAMPRRQQLMRVLGLMPGIRR